MVLDEARLRDALRAVLEDPELDFRGAPEDLGGGGDARAWGVALHAPASGIRAAVVRILERPGASAELEAVVQNHVADAGFPAVRSFFATDDAAILGAPFQVVERAAGVPLFGGGLRQQLRSALRFGSLLAALELRLHALDVDALLEACRASGVPTEALAFETQWQDVRAQAEACPECDLRPLAEWLEATRPGPPLRRVICHCDLNPENVFVDPRGEVCHVIDWTGVKVHEPELPIGTLHGALAAFPQLRFAAPLLRRNMAAYLAAHHAAQPLDAGRIRWYEAFTCCWLLARSFAGVARSPWPWAGPRGRRAVARHLARLGAPADAYRL